MKTRRAVASAMLCLLLAGTTLASADPGRGRGDGKGDRGKSEEKSKQEQSRKRTVRRSPDRDGRVSERRVVETRRAPSRSVASSAWHDRGVRGRAQHTTWAGHRARSWGSEHRSWRDRGGYRGYRVPDHRYRVAFGPSHRFRVDRCPLVLVGGHPRFYHGGYWVTFIDPWPEYWAENWYERDDCYVVYADDGYYLTNVRYPRARIAVSFTVG